MLSTTAPHSTGDRHPHCIGIPAACAAVKYAVPYATVSQIIRPEIATFMPNRRVVIRNHDDELCCVDTVEVIRHHDRPLGAAGVEYLEQFPHLSRLRFNRESIDAAGLAALVKLSHQLHYLVLSWCSSINAAGICHVAKLVQLRHLDLSGWCGVDTAVLAEIATLPNLRHLNLNYCRGVDAAGLAEVSKLTQLQHLDLRDCSGVDMASLAEIAKLSQLQHLDLSCCRGVCATGLAEIAELVHLQHLDLSECYGVDPVRLAAGVKPSRLQHMIRLVSDFRPDLAVSLHLKLGAQFEQEENYQKAQHHFISGKDWRRAVSMYREAGMWEDAARIADVHGGASAAKEEVLTRAMNATAQDGLTLLASFSLLDDGIDAALKAHEFDFARQWAQFGMPSKLPDIFDRQGDFRSAERAWVKAGKAREAVSLYRRQSDFDSAMRVAESHDAAEIPGVCNAQGRALFQEGRFAKAEDLMLRADAAKELQGLFEMAGMRDDAQRVLEKMLPECSGGHQPFLPNDIRRGDLLRSVRYFEENGHERVAIDNYLRAGPEHTSDIDALAQGWLRAVELSAMHARHTLKNTLKTAVCKLVDNDRIDEGVKCLEENEDSDAAITEVSKAAITCCVRAGQIDQAATLARRISPEMVDHAILENHRVMETGLQACTAAPDDDLGLSGIHDELYASVEDMKRTGQPQEDVDRSQAVLDVLHIYATVPVLKAAGMPDFAAMLMSTLPRHVDVLPADKVYYDAGVAAKDAGDFGTAVMYLCRYLDICDNIEDAGNCPDNSDFDCTDCSACHHSSAFRGRPPRRSRTGCWPNAWRQTSTGLCPR